MSSKLRDYQVLDVKSGGAVYKVKHKQTQELFTWKAYNCKDYSEKYLENIVSDIKLLSQISEGGLLRYFDTILHKPSKTLYLVLEHTSARTLHNLLETSNEQKQYLQESFIWKLLHELARILKAIEHIQFQVLSKVVNIDNIFVDDNHKIKINCIELLEKRCESSVTTQVGELLNTIRVQHHNYSDDLMDVVCFLLQNSDMKADVILYHPTVLANLECLNVSSRLSEQIELELNNTNNKDKQSIDSNVSTLEICKKESFTDVGSPLYINSNHIVESSSAMSPGLAALALDLPGYVPRNTIVKYNEPQLVSENTLSNQWMSRLIALREREESLNRRERDILAKEIVSSPTTIITLVPNESPNNIGITLPPMLNNKVSDKANRRVRRSSLNRARRCRKSCNYEDMDSSLSADQGDDSIVVTGTKFSKENIPRYPNKKVHFTSVNPFVESDESVQLTFYELGDKNRINNDITKFKYLDLEQITNEKRAARTNWMGKSPRKQAKLNAFSDITNKSDNQLVKVPSELSITSKNSSKYSACSQKSFHSDKTTQSFRSKTRSSILCAPVSRQSLAPTHNNETNKKIKGRKSLLSFKTPFKFMNSTKV